VAEILNMSPRTLQRKLGDARTTYKDVLNETRHDLALAYLSAPRHSVSEVTYLLGFSAVSCFTRAFRRWTGQSPTAWRAAARVHSRARQGARHNGAEGSAAGRRKAVPTGVSA
jgi:AraC-like DNA-binding protein